MSTTEIINLIVVVAGFATVIKFLFGLKDEIYELKDEVAKLNSKFDRLDERQISSKEQLAITNTRIDKLEIEIKEHKVETKEIWNKFFDLIPRPAL